MGAESALSQMALSAWAGAAVDELARAGVKDLCLCPGSRSTPLALLAHRHPALRLWVHLDERSAGFFALGLAKAHRAPVAVLTTSGTAAANLLPAVTEAWHGRVALLVLTADRPPELREVGALQTIDQVRLYGSRVKWSLDLPLPSAEAGALRHLRATVDRAVERARRVPCGPVHLNFPFREPLLPGEVEGHEEVWPATPQVRPLPAYEVLESMALNEVVRAVTAAERGLVVCGPQDDPNLPLALVTAAQAAGWPVLADALSGVRCGRHLAPVVIDGYDLFLRDPAMAEVLRPDLVIRLGGVPVSKALLHYLDVHAEVPQLMVDPGGAWSDPLCTASMVVRCDPTWLSVALIDRLSGPAERGLPTGAGGWLDRWRWLSGHTRDTVRSMLRRTEELTEPRAILELTNLMPADTNLVVGNSMPVRDLDAFLPIHKRPLRILGNRGASGIDGVVSTGLGVAAAGVGRTVILLGDVSLYHDLNGLLAAKRFSVNATIVVVNNDGGGIFSLLPQATVEDGFEELFGTPHGLDFRHAAELYGLAYRRPSDCSELRRVFSRAMRSTGVTLVEIRTDRKANADLHAELWHTVATSVSSGSVWSLRGKVRRGRRKSQMT